MLYNLLHMDLENYFPVQIKPKAEKSHECLRTSEKIRHILAKFPSSKPVADNFSSLGHCNENAHSDYSASNPNSVVAQPIPPFPGNMESEANSERQGNGLEIRRPERVKKGKALGVIAEVVQVLQLVVSATALALYYIIYGWMHLVYTGLRIAMFFRDSDRPMKVTLLVVAVTSVIVTFNVLLRIHKIYTHVVR